MLRRDNFNLDEEKKKDIDWRANKIIFELRRTALLTDDELTENEKSMMENTVKENDQYKVELMVQQKVKGIFISVSYKDNIPQKLQSYLQKKAKKRFG
jgi:hypothetical protein